MVHHVAAFRMANLLFMSTGQVDDFNHYGCVATIHMDIVDVNGRISTQKVVTSIWLVYDHLS